MLVIKQIVEIDVIYIQNHWGIEKTMDKATGTESLKAHAPVAFAHFWRGTRHFLSIF
jgi:hypothetical protein